MTDEALNRVTVFSTTGEVQNAWGEAGAGPGQLDHPSGIVVDSDDNLLIADSGNNRIQKFTVGRQVHRELGCLWFG